MLSRRLFRIKNIGLLNPGRNFFSEKKTNKFDFEQFWNEQRKKEREDILKSQKGNIRENEKNKITVPPVIKRDFEILNLPYSASLTELKLQYHKLAKIYHPDHSVNNEISQDRFQELQMRYQRILSWIKDRDSLIEQVHGHLNIQRNEDGSITQHLGKATHHGKTASYLTKKQILDDMIEKDNFEFHEPKRINLYILLIGLLIGYLTVCKDLKKYLIEMSQPRNSE